MCIYLDIVHILAQKVGGQSNKQHSEEIEIDARLNHIHYCYLATRKYL